MDPSTTREPIIKQTSPTSVDGEQILQTSPAPEKFVKQVRKWTANVILCVTISIEHDETRVQFSV